MDTKKSSKWLRVLRSAVLAALAVFMLVNPGVIAGHLDSSPAVLSLRTNPNRPDEAAIRGISNRNSAGSDDIPIGVIGRTTGDSTGTDSRVDAVWGAASGNATGVGARIRGVFGTATGNATSENSQLVAIQGNVEGSATGLASRLRGVIGVVTGNAEGANAQLHGVSGIVSGNATGPNSRIRGVTASVEGSASGTNAEIQAVSGFATATSGRAVAGTFIVESAPGYGVVGNAIAPNGSTIGVFGLSQSPDGVAVQGNGDNGAKAGLFNGRVDINCSAGSPCLVVNGGVVGDLAENMPTVGIVGAADVVVLALGKQGVGIARAKRPYDTRVAGIVSTSPRIRFGTAGGRASAAVAMVGIVPAKVTALNGPIEPGDLLTTSSVPGHLMRCSSAIRCTGAIVGKALESLARGNGRILVLIWRQ